MPIALHERHPSFAAEIQGIDMRQPATPEVVSEIEAAIDRFPVLVFPEQHITDEQQVAFTRPFGELQVSTAARTGREQRLNAEMTDASNISAENRVLEAGDARRMNNLGSRRWHTDGSFNRVPVKYSLLSGRIVAEQGGETQLADMRAAYDSLPDNLKLTIEDLLAHHSLIHSRAVVGFAEASPDERTILATVSQRLVRRHPRTRRKSLYLSNHAAHIVGWPIPEGLDLLYDLMDRATQPAHVYTHKWRVGDLLMWDNRVTMHRARRHYPENTPRDMRRTSIMDVGNTVEQAA
ncbi:MAG: TauD/TfdA family dioxygenase [Alphaproteobacteria bacterium]|nr:TauD/TfdA family dioxygenase [Alphaproteobacteria bacterium]